MTEGILNFLANIFNWPLERFLIFDLSMPNDNVLGLKPNL